MTGNEQTPTGAAEDGGETGTGGVHHGGGPDAHSDHHDGGIARLPRSHAVYIRAVAEALEAAGVPVADWRADDDAVPEGWIPFDLARQVRLHGRPVWDHDEAGAGWAENRGWYLLTVDDPGGRNVRSVHTLPVATRAAPDSVARAVVTNAGLSPRRSD